MQIDNNILVRYFLKQASEEEKESIHQWMEESETNKTRFIRERIRFDASILADENKIVINNRSIVNRSLRVSMQIAASILILLGSIWMFDTYKMNKLANTFQAVRVPAGNRTNITLPDGTDVWLNANTELKYPVVFSKNSREVVLDGEAYFDVSKSKIPFIVKTDKYNVEVLGTTLDIEAYSGSPIFKTALFTGKVKLYNDNQDLGAVYLIPGQTAQLVDNKLQVSSTINVDSYRWRDGLICIENNSFTEIMLLFEKYYDVKIVIKNKGVKTLGYWGKLRIADGINHALRVLQNDFPFTYERDEESNIIYIY